MTLKYAVSLWVRLWVSFILSVQFRSVGHLQPATVSQRLPFKRVRSRRSFCSAIGTIGEMLKAVAGTAHFSCVAVMGCSVADSAATCFCNAARVS